jgi:type VII secretion integral membrane protein EccD
MTLTSTYLRTSVVLPENTIDVQLPADSPVEDVIYELIRFLKVELAKQNRNVDWLLDEGAVWTLERFGRRQLDGEQSLSEQGVLDGERLFLSKNARNETYPALIDDIAESVEKHQKDFPAWTELDASRVAALALGLVGSLLFLGSALFVGWGLEPGSVLRWPVIGVVIAVALLASGLSVPLFRSGSSLLGTSLLSMGYTGVAAASFMAIPRRPSLWHITVSGTCVLVFAAVMITLAPAAKRLHAAVLTAASVVTVVSLINFFYPVSPAVIGVQAATLAYLLILMSSRIAMAAAKVETPYVPAAGESLNTDGGMIGEVTRKSTSREVIESVVNQREQTHAAHYYLMGMMLGAMAVFIGSAVFSGLYADDRRWLLLAFYASVAISLLNRARNYVNRDAHIILLISAGGTMVAYLMALTVSDTYGNMLQIATGTGLLCFTTLIGGLWALGQKSIKAPTTRRWFELFEVAMYSAPILWLGVLMDVYSKARNR